MKRLSWLLAGALLLGAPVAGAGQGTPVPVDGLASGPFATLEMLYERTIFNIDILDLFIRVDPGTAATLERLGGRVDGEDLPESLADALADAVVSAPEALVRTRFRRGVSVKQFLDGMRGTLETAASVGYLAPETAAEVAAGGRAWFSELGRRGFREDDVLWYRLRGDTLDMVLQDRAGETVLRKVRDGGAIPEALLGGYMARGSDFRQKLLASLFRARDTEDRGSAEDRGAGAR